MFEIEYIYHDCFLIITPEAALIFDYWKPPVQDGGVIPHFFRRIPQDRPLYVFVSHFHKDHYNKDIFSWPEIHPNIQFILSKDTARHAGHILRADTLYKGKRPESSTVHILKKGEDFQDEILTIKAFGSTDIGNSYAIEVNESGLKIFHAGDLNCWSWRDESTPEEIAEAEKAYRMELDPIAKEYPELDIVMFPVDSRIGTGYYEGAARFVKAIRVKHFFPMHFELADSQEELEKRKADAIAFEKYASGDGEFIGLRASGDRYRNNKD